MSSQFVLINKNPNLPVADFKLAPGEYTLGRTSDCDLPIRDSTISRLHARLVVADSTIQVTDLASRNGTFIESQQIQSGMVTISQHLRFGRVVFLVDDMHRYLPPPHSQECATDIYRKGHHVLTGESEESATRSVLTASQMRVLACMLEGMTEKEAGTKLGISRHTVHNHIREIYAQLGVRSRGELLAKFIPPNINAIVNPPGVVPPAPNWIRGETEPGFDVLDLD